MARKPLPAAEVVDSGVSTATITAKSEAANQLALASQAISERFGDGLAYNRERVVHEARFFMAQSAEAMLEAGKRLIQLKENEPHGEFTAIVTEQLGLGERSARQMMAAAVKYLSPALESKRQALAVLGRTKLFDLMAEDDGDLAALAEGGTLADKTIDEIDAMSSRELKAALRQAREEAAAKDKVIAAKNRKLDKIAEEEELARQAPLPEQEKAQLDELRDDTLAAESALQRMLTTVDEFTQTPATDAVSVAARHSLDYLVQRIVDGCLERGITVDLAERVTPIWAQQIEGAAKARRGAKAR